MYLHGEKIVFEKLTNKGYGFRVPSKGFDILLNPLHGKKLILKAHIPTDCLVPSVQKTFKSYKKRIAYK
jgi:hypothetical protein